MALGPYTMSTLQDGFVRYGNWTGNDYSANSLSPDFVALTAAQEAVPGYDPFDAVSAVHDEAYNKAQQSLLLNLENGVSGSTAMVAYLTALEQADQSFVATAPTAAATTSWGQTVQQISIKAISVKADWEAADIQRIQTDPVYAAKLDALATPASTAAAVRDTASFDSANATPESVVAYKARLYGDSPFLAQTQDPVVAVSGAVQDPALVPEILAGGTDVSLFLGNSVVDEMRNSTVEVSNGDTIVLNGNSGSLAIHGIQDITFIPGATGSMPTFESIAASVTTPSLIRDIATAVGPGIPQTLSPPTSGFADILNAASASATSVSVLSGPSLFQ